MTTGHTAPITRSAVWVPLFDELADPHAVVQLAVEAESAGWDGFFVWDHIRWREPVRAAADPWIVLAAVAAATDRIRLGPMVTPPGRRRPAKLARETATLDQLSDGRLVLGIGIGSDQFGEEFSRFGEETEDATRAAMTDETLEILRTAWSGEPVQHRGTHHVVDDVAFLPRPVQRPGVPIWIAGLPGRTRPMRRAARHDGFFPVNLSGPDELAAAVDTVLGLRPAGAAPFDIAVEVSPKTDPAPYRAAGATWCLTNFEAHGTTVDLVRGVISDGPPA
ncbi:MAG TPA: LLM class flavin-dependent oxidoreductase [Aeromicrobium sp.]|nr:LLM class flavin-dependent oxidoreductase [Aeromicrobium sp.]